MNLVRITASLLILICSVINPGLWAAEEQMANKGSLKVSDGWVRLTPPVVKNAAAYFNLENISDDNLIIIGVQTKIADKALMHQVVSENEMVRMEHMERLKLNPGETQQFSPGGKHLMLINLHQPLREHEMVSFSFLLENGDVIVSEMPVLRQAPSDEDTHQHHHH